MYLVYVLENRGYPVRQVFEQEVKQIATERFTDFDAKRPVPDEAYSFHSDDSFELLV